jgi:hypothetical protein
MTQYGGKPMATLTDRQLELAEEDVANCLLHAYAAPKLGPVQKDADGNVQKDASGNPVTDHSRYTKYFQSLSDQANAIQEEKARRG